MQLTHLLESVERLLSRFRHPVSLPEDVAKDLGVHLANSLTFEELIFALGRPGAYPKKLKRWMSRREAESAFQGAIRKEIFRSSSLFSYYFNKGWIVMTLYFDEDDLLRRLYVQCPSCESIEGFDIPLPEPFIFRTIALQ